MINRILGVLSAAVLGIILMAQYQPNVIISSPGAKGATGATGPSGITGPTGPGGGDGGSVGPTGPIGPTGIAGPTGATGPVNTTGSPGFISEFFDAGVPGTPGFQDSIIFDYDAGQSLIFGDIQPDPDISGNFGSPALTEFHLLDGGASSAAVAITNYSTGAAGALIILNEGNTTPALIVGNFLDGTSAEFFNPVLFDPHSTPSPPTLGLYYTDNTTGTLFGCDGGACGPVGSVPPNQSCRIDAGSTCTVTVASTTCVPVCSYVAGTGTGDGLLNCLNSAGTVTATDRGLTPNVGLVQVGINCQ